MLRATLTLQPAIKLVISLIACSVFTPGFNLPID
jgi:hypothetical protein